MMLFSFRLVILVSRVIQLFFPPFFPTFLSSFLPSFFPTFRLLLVLEYLAHFSAHNTFPFHSLIISLPSLLPYLHSPFMSVLLYPIHLFTSISTSTIIVTSLISLTLPIIHFLPLSLCLLILFRHFRTFSYSFYILFILGQRTEKLFEAVDRAAKQFSRRIPTAIINEVVQGKEMRCVLITLSISTITLLTI